MIALETTCKEVNHALRDLSSITAHDVSKLGRVVTEAELERAKQRLPLFMQIIGLLNLKLVPVSHVAVNENVLRSICVLLSNELSSEKDFTNAILGDKQ